MGITINYKLGQARQYLKGNIDNLEKVAGYYKLEADRRGIEFNIERKGEFSLRVDIGKCETLAFYFKTVKEINEAHEKANGFEYVYEVLTNGGKKELEAGYEIETYPFNEMFYCADFCKTQFCKDLWEHKAVADLIRAMASYCSYAEVKDEGDYYHTGELKDAFCAIHENGLLIDSIGGQLKKAGFDVISGDKI